MTRRQLDKDISKYLNNISNRVGEVITEYDWRECCGLIQELKKYSQSEFKINHILMGDDSKSYRVSYLLFSIFGYKHFVEFGPYFKTLSEAADFVIDAEEYGRKQAVQDWATGKAVMQQTEEDDEEFIFN